jgi:hypothetical protein
MRHKTSIPAIFEKYYRSVTINGRTRKTLTIGIKEKPIILWPFAPKKESVYKGGWVKPEADTKPQTVHEWATGRSMSDRIETMESSDRKCSYCGTTENVQMHHIGGLRDLKTVKQKHRAGQAKQKVTLCKSCHLNTGHHGSFAPKDQGNNAA